MIYLNEQIFMWILTHNIFKHYRCDFNVTVEELYFTVGSLCTAADPDSHMVFVLIPPQGLRGKHGVRRSELE